MPTKFEKVEKVVIGKDKDGKDILKTKYTYKKILIALNPEEHKLWKNEFKNKGFDSLTSMIRTAVNLLFDEIPNPEEFKPKTSANSERLENEVSDLKKLILGMIKEQRKSNQDFLSLNRQMLKFLSNGKVSMETIKKGTIQEKIFSLIKEKPRMVEELIGIFGIDETEIMKRLNALGEGDFIRFDREKMEWRHI